MSKGVVSVVFIFLAWGIFGTAPAAGQYGGMGGSGGNSGGSTMPGPAKPPASPFTFTKLVSDQPGAAQLDSHLVNAWGLVAGPATPWWVNNNTTNTSTLYNGSGTVIPLVVTVPGGPTGIVFNGGSQFALPSGPATFLFATQSGMVSGWNTSSGSVAATVADRSADGAIYKGLALASTASGDVLYATDFHNRRVDMFDGSFNAITSANAFVDKKIPKRFAPFGIQNINGTLFVTYAKQDKNKQIDVPGVGLGFVDTFDTSGNLLGRVATKGALDAPWGMALAPSNFGTFSGDLLVGNFGNGKIDAYQQQANGHWKPRGALRGTDGKPLKIDGLWGLSFGNDGLAGPASSLYVTAGPDGGSHGLLASIQAAG